MNMVNDILNGIVALSGPILTFALVVIAIRLWHTAALEEEEVKELKKRNKDLEKHLDVTTDWAATALAKVGMLEAEVRRLTKDIKAGMPSEERKGSDA